MPPAPLTLMVVDVAKIGFVFRMTNGGSAKASIGLLGVAKATFRWGSGVDET